LAALPLRLIFSAQDLRIELLGLNTIHPIGETTFLPGLASVRLT
jgi:hypothetical protein